MSNGGLPHWLPEMVSVSPWTNDTYDLLYEIFRRDILLSRLTYRRNRVWFYPQSSANDKEDIFWHLTTREDQSVNPPERYPDLRRCERLSWIKPMILGSPDEGDDLLDWDHEEGDGAIKTYVWLHRLDFVVIMKKLRDGQRRLITSFHLDNQHQRDKMRRKYERRMR